MVWLNNLCVQGKTFSECLEFKLAHGHWKVFNENQCHWSVYSNRNFGENQPSVQCHSQILAYFFFPINIQSLKRLRDNKLQKNNNRTYMKNVSFSPNKKTFRLSNSTLSYKRIQNVFNDRSLKNAERKWVQSLIESLIRQIIIIYFYSSNLENMDKKKKKVALNFACSDQKSTYLWCVPFVCHTNKWLSWIPSEQRTAVPSSLLVAHSQSPALVHSCVRTLSLLLCVSHFQWLYTTPEPFSIRHQ